MTNKQQSAAQARLEVAKNQSPNFNPNGFQGTRSEVLEGTVIDKVDRTGYSIIYFTDSKNRDWTLLLNEKSDSQVTEDTTEVTIAASRDTSKVGTFWITNAK
jgi:hypothetical protein